MIRCLDLDVRMVTSNQITLDVSVLSSDIVRVVPCNLLSVCSGEKMKVPEVSEPEALEDLREYASL
jgi:hypothetical protein